MTATRLTGRRQFAAVREAGRRAGSGMVRVQARANQSGVLRVGFALPGMGSAVRRNRVRRRLRAALRAAVDPGQAFDLVVSAPPGAANAPYAQLLAEVAQAVAQAVGVPRPAERLMARERSR